MKIAVTGANGLIGRAAVERLVGRHELLALGRGSWRHGPGAFEYRPCDLGDGHTVEEALRDFRPAAVLHAGAFTDVDACERSPDEAYRVNLGGTEQVARACRDLKARLVAVSTDYVFDGEAGPYGEGAVPNPRGVYARTKRMGEEAASLIAKNCAVARVAVVYSGLPGSKETFATSVVRKLSRGESVKAFSDQIVSPTLADNGAAMLLELLLEKDFVGVLHTSGATCLDRVDFAQRVARRFGLDPAGIRPVKAADVALAAPRPLRGGLKVERAAALLSVAPLAIEDALSAFAREWTSRSERQVAGGPA